MPHYEYRREDGTTFEVFQRITDEPLTKDPETGQKVRRVISGGVGLQFKGTGFYLTDYARKPNGSASSDEGASSESSEGKTESAKDTKAGSAATPAADD